MHRTESVTLAGAQAAGTANTEGVRRQWSAPVVEALPRLNALTLQSPIPGGGSIGGGGASTVF